MLTKLTKAQRASFQPHVAEWVAISLSTQRMDKVAAEAALRQVYARGGLPWHGRIVWTTSPLAMVLTHSAFLNVPAMESSVRDSVGDSVWASVRDSVGDSVGDSVRDSVWASVKDSVVASVRASVGASVGDSVWASVGDSVGASVGASVGDSVWASVRDSFGASVGASVRDSVRDSVWASVVDSVNSYWQSSYLAYYVWFGVHGGLAEMVVPLDGLIALHKSAGWWFPCRHVTLVADRPVRLCRDDAGRLHADDGPAMQWPDGWAIYALHGVRVPDWLVETPACELDAQKLLKIDNAEVRREFVRKVGIERVCLSLNAQVVDHQGDYELLMLDLQDGRQRPYLKMRNPSIGVWHVEGVHPTCQTVQQALNWRASGDIAKDWQPEQLT